MPFINDNYIIERYKVKDDGIFPNNNKLEVLLYKHILNLPPVLPAFKIKKLFKANNWYNFWQDGIYSFHHYHSITHEVLGVYRGKTTLLIGGESGIKISVEKNDVLIIPVGVAHKNLETKNKVKCVGAYPRGKKFDMNYGNSGERPRTNENIKKVPLPAKDPVFGLNGFLQKIWKK